jgi:KipI family sensor histidine kinase inhibitor
MLIAPASDSSLFIRFGDAISLDAHRQVTALFHAIQQLHDARIRNLHPAYASLLIDFDPFRLTHEELERIVAPLLRTALPPKREAGPILEIPVCYDCDFAPDLTSVAHHSSLTAEQVIAIHSGGEYFVYFLGFSPGFAYLGGGPRRLHVPRLPSPRKHVSAGSVGLAGGQTGIYPNDSPGGWQLIGRTPLRMFVPSADPPSRLQLGDRVRFRRITRDEFDRLASEQGSHHDSCH